MYVSSLKMSISRKCAVSLFRLNLRYIPAHELRGNDIASRFEVAE